MVFYGDFKIASDTGVALTFLYKHQIKMVFELLHCKRNANGWLEYLYAKAFEVGTRKVIKFINTMAAAFRVVFQKNYCPTTIFNTLENPFRMLLSNALLVMGLSFYAL
jgi:hypothetical protein